MAFPLTRYARALPTAAYGLTALLLLGVLARTIGLGAAIEGALAICVVAIVPGAMAVNSVFRRPTILHYVVLGALIGFGLMAIGGLLSHFTAVFFMRWVPSALVVILVTVAKIRGGRSRPSADRWMYFGSWQPLVGSFVALVSLIPSLRVALTSQPITWHGWWSFYPDLSFHAALASEAAARSPESDPWVAGTPLSYTWLFHSAMGVLSSSTFHLTAADAVLQLWPVIFVVLIPAAIALVSVELTGSRWVGATAPLLYVLMRGLQFAPNDFKTTPLFQISPTRDFATFFVLLAVLSLAKVLGPFRALDGSRWKWLAMLAFSVFVATGSKGSAAPVLVGALGCAVLVLVATRRLSRFKFLAIAVFIASAALSYIATLPDPGLTERLSWDPLTFLSSDTQHRSLLSLGLVLVSAFGIVAASVIASRAESERGLIAGILGGVPLAGLAGLALIDYPGASQNYFWQSSQAILSILVALAFRALISRMGRDVAVAVLVVFTVSNVIPMLTANIVLLILSSVLISLAAAIVLVIFGKRRTSSITSVMLIVLVAGLLTFATYQISIPSGTLGGNASSAADSTAIDSSQLAAFEYLRLHSEPSQIVATNRHCRSGSIQEGDCDQRWFALAAGSERPVLVEGWGYTQFGPSTNWVANRLNRSQAFVLHPSLSSKSRLEAEDVDYVYIDKRNPYSLDIGKFSTRVYDSEWAIIFKLR